MDTSKRIDEILKVYHDKLLMTETEYDIKQRGEAKSLIMELVNEARKSGIPTSRREEK